jgi:hypothetical protein
MKRPLPPLLPMLLVVLTGCHLIDQKTFAPSPEAKPPAPPGAPPPPPRIDPRSALVTIDYTTANPDYRDLLSLAVRAAQARDHAVQFDVVSVAKTIDAASAAQDHAVEVMRAILTEKVAASRVHLGLRVDPTLTNPQVRVYVR